jgi:hypothetical protein
METGVRAGERLAPVAAIGTWGAIAPANFLLTLFLLTTFLLATFLLTALHHAILWCGRLRSRGRHVLVST